MYVCMHVCMRKIYRFRRNSQGFRCRMACSIAMSARSIATQSPTTSTAEG